MENSRTGDVAESRGTGLRYRDGSERPGSAPTEGEPDFEMRGSDAFRLAPEINYGMVRPVQATRPWPQMSDNELYQFPDRREELVPDGVEVNRDRKQERFGPPAVASEGNTLEARSVKDTKKRST